MEYFWNGGVSPGAFALACAVALLAGVIKGTLGFALPLVIVAGLSLFLDPFWAVVGVVLPALATNMMQVFRYRLDEIRAILRVHWRFVLIVAVLITIATQALAHISPRAFYLILGIPVVVISAIQLGGWRLRVPPRWYRVAEVVAAVLAGGIGGISGTWGPPVVLYLLAIDAPQAQRMAVQGLIYFVAAVVFLAGHIAAGSITWVTGQFSAALVIPAMIGMRAGFYIGARTDTERLRTVTMAVLIIAGLVMIRRAIVV